MKRTLLLDVSRLDCWLSQMASAIGAQRRMIASNWLTKWTLRRGTKLPPPFICVSYTQLISLNSELCNLELITTIINLR